MKYMPIDKGFFINNRKKFIKQMKPSSMAIFNSNDEMPRSADQNFPFRQNSDTFYLCGIDQEKTILLLYPDAANVAYREILFLRKTNEHIAIWEGNKYALEEARNASGVETLFWLDEFENIFNMLMKEASNVYLNMNEHGRFTTEVPYKDIRFANKIKQEYPLHNYERSAPILADLRSIKSEEEIKQIQTAVDITEKAFRRVLNLVKPGVMEYEIEAEITHEFIRNRATCHSYSPIIASGANACILHYVHNNQKCKEGEVVLMDFGAEYANYAADLTRSIPVNGKFTKRQKEVYNAVLRVMKAAKQMLIVGNTLEEYNKSVGKIMEEELIRLELLDAKEVAKQDQQKPLYKKYFMHGISHFLGLDVHDVGNKNIPMKAGMVFTCEPGIYIPEEGLGVRLENDILITEKGPVDLMENIPIESDEIEELMAKSLQYL